MTENKALAILTVQHPTPSESFNSTEIIELKKYFDKIKIFNLKAPHENELSLIKDQALQNIKISSSSFYSVIYGIFLACCKTPALIELFLIIFKNVSFTKLEFYKCLAFIPRSFSIAKELLSYQPDYIYLMWGHYTCLPAILYNLISKKSSAQTTQFLGAYDLKKTPKLSSYFANSFAKNVRTHSYSNIKTLEKIGIKKSKIVILYRGCKLYEKISVNHKDPNLIISAGRLIVEKHFDQVILTFAKYKKRYNPYASLKIAGDGPEKANLLRLIKDLRLESNVQLLGHLDQLELFKLMNKAQYFLFLSASASERLPNVIKEAMYRECICISSNTAGIKELIDPDFSGFIISSENTIDTIFSKISLQTPTTKSAMGKAAKMKIIQNFNVQHIAKKLYEIITN